MPFTPFSSTFIASLASEPSAPRVGGGYKGMLVFILCKESCLCQKVETTDWTIIPLENLIAQREELYSVVKNEEEARLAIKVESHKRTCLIQVKVVFRQI